MLSNVRLIMGLVLGLAVLGLGVYIGYQIGARKVAKLENDIKAYETASNEAQAKLKASQDEIDKTLKDKDAEYAKQAQQLKSDADQRSNDLSAALAGANAKTKSLQAQIANTNAIRANLVKEMGTASEAEKKALQAKIDTLDRENSDRRAKIQGNECLMAAVPEEVIRPLAAATGFGLKLALVLSAAAENTRPLTADN